MKNTKKLFFFNSFSIKKNQDTFSKYDDDAHFKTVVGLLLSILAQYFNDLCIFEIHENTLKEKKRKEIK